VAAFTGASGAKVLAQNYNSFNEYSPEKAAARSAHLARRFAPGGKPAWDVNLHGHGACRAELAELLAAAGLKTAPRGNDLYSAVRGSRLQVLAAPDEVLEAALAAAGRSFVVPPAPYGFGGTAAWLKAVLGALRPARKPARPAPSLAAEYAALRRRAAAYEAGFVLSASDLAAALAPGAFNGVPVIAFLAEAGFALRFMLPSEDKAKAAAGLAALRRALPGCKMTAAYFNGPAGLDELLRSGRLRLVYSDIGRDARVLAAGRTPFSAGIFEAGYAGAAETARRLLELCDWDFNEKYLA
jgi:hypothetical protein